MLNILPVVGLGDIRITSVPCRWTCKFACMPTTVDNGRPTMVADPDGDVAGIYKAVAHKMAVSIAAKNIDCSSQFPTITISKNT